VNLTDFTSFPKFTNKIIWKVLGCGVNGDDDPMRPSIRKVEAGVGATGAKGDVTPLKTDVDIGGPAVVSKLVKLLLTKLVMGGTMLLVGGLIGEPPKSNPSRSSRS
jgi:hypothetical protein